MSSLRDLDMAEGGCPHMAGATRAGDAACATQEFPQAGGLE
jgi:hypothetical protein